MAAFIDIGPLVNNSDLQTKIEVALQIAVQNVLDGTPTVDDQRYAAQVFAHPRSEGKKFLISVLAKNHTATVVQILGAADTGPGSYLNNVETVLPAMTAAWIAGQV